jgi:predicted nucleic acid-binding protein
LGLIYLDACILIYAIERHQVWGEPLRRRFGRDSSESYAISPLVISECLVGPLRAGNPALLAAFEAVFAAQIQLPLIDDVYRAAAQLRADHRLKTPDALHLACALHHRCTALWTNDTRLHAASGGIAQALGELA